MIWSWILNIFGYDFLKNIDDEEIENKKDCGDIEPDNKPEGDKGKDPVTVDKISDEISDNAEEIEVMEQIARDYVDLHMKHYQKNGSRYNYDCLGTALVCEKMFLQQFDKELDTANKWVNKQRPEWVPGIKGAYYNMLGMEEMKNLGDEVSPDELKVGDFIKIDEVILEITQKCTICNHLSVFDKKLPKVVKDCRGLYCKIIKSGKIEKNMNVSFLTNEDILEYAS